MRRLVEQLEEPRHRAERALVRLLLWKEAEHRLGADHPNREAVVVLARLVVGVDELHARHGLEIAAAAMEDELDMRQQLEPPTEARHRLPHPLRHRADAPVRARVEVENAVGLADPDRAENDRLRAVCPSGHVRLSLGVAYDGWHAGQNEVPRPPTTVFAIGVPQRSHGSPARP